MSSLTDFDYQPHRTVAAAVAFQKGIYHLFVLRGNPQTDSYEKLLRSYQCIFQLGVTLVLLDEAFLLNALLGHLPGPLKGLCGDPTNPRRDELDPACVITHSVFERSKWAGFPKTHTLAPIGTEVLKLYERVVKARHNLLYRPFLLDNTKPPFSVFAPFWEDCTLQGLIGGAPRWQEIEASYRRFAAALWEWRNCDRRSEIPQKFIFALFEPYIDRGGQQPPATVLLRYARLLSSDNQAMLAGLLKYRNELVDQDRHAVQSGIGFPSEWNVGEI